MTIKPNSIWAPEGSAQDLGFKVQGLPRPSYVVPFWVVYDNPLPKNHNKPKKEQHWSPWVGFRNELLVTLRLRAPEDGTRSYAAPFSVCTTASRMSFAAYSFGCQAFKGLVAADL